MTFREKRKRQTFTLDLIARSYETKFVVFALRQRAQSPRPHVKRERARQIAWPGRYLHLSMLAFTSIVAS